LAAVTVLLIQMMRHYQRLTSGITKKDLKNVLTMLLDRNEEAALKMKDLNLAINELKEKSKNHIQKVGFVRFNPFPATTGGDQSFVLSLLDENDTGFVLSSLHSRDTTRFYAKVVKNGKGDGHELSKEELKAIKNAQ
jgi:hypothetical protein